MRLRTELYIEISNRRIRKSASGMNTSLNFVPSPISFDYKQLYSALANDAGRMQYYRSHKDGNRTRIGKNEFVRAYNDSDILAIKPIPSKSNAFQLQFYV